MSADVVYRTSCPPPAYSPGASARDGTAPQHQEAELRAIRRRLGLLLVASSSAVVATVAIFFFNADAEMVARTLGATLAAAALVKLAGSRT